MIWLSWVWALTTPISFYCRWTVYYSSCISVAKGLSYLQFEYPDPFQVANPLFWTAHNYSHIPTLSHLLVEEISNFPYYLPSKPVGNADFSKVYTAAGHLWLISVMCWQLTNIRVFCGLLTPLYVCDLRPWHPGDSSDHPVLVRFDRYMRWRQFANTGQLRIVSVY